MEARPIREYMTCMENLLYLKNVPAGEPIRGRRNMRERKLPEHLDDFLRSLDKDNLDMRLTHDADECGSLRNWAVQLRERAEGGAALPAEAGGEQHSEVSTATWETLVVSEQEAASIRELAVGIEHVLKAEALQIWVYEMETAERIDVEKLLNRVEEFFAPKVFEFLPQIAQFDFREAAKALAFKLPMGAATLSFRACEATFRGYFFLLRGERPDPRSPFGQLRRHLKKWNEEQQNDRYAHTLDYLGNVVGLRNRTIHPQRRYVIREAESLFRMCTDACSHMIEDLAPRAEERNESDLLKRLVSQETQEMLFHWIQAVDSPAAS